MHVNVLVWLILEASLSDMQIIRWEIDMLWYEYTLIRVKLDSTCVLVPHTPTPTPPRGTETSTNASRSFCEFSHPLFNFGGENWHIWTVAKLNFEPICSWGWNHVGHYEKGGSWLLIVFILTHCQLLKMF